MDVPMRRKEKQLAQDDSASVLQSGEYGVLSISRGDAAPYGVPLSYVYLNGAVYIHCAREGYKLDLMAANPRVSFCVVGRTTLLPERFTTAYESVLLSGTAQGVSGAEKEDALRALIAKYAPSHQPEGDAYIAKAAAKTEVVKISIDCITGKASPARTHGP